MMKEFQMYNTVTNQYAASGNLPREKKLNGYIATNIGDTAVRVNDDLLGPAIAPAIVGDSITIGGNEGEIYTDRITVSFVLPLGANPLVQIKQKYFITDQSYK